MEIIEKEIHEYEDGQKKVFTKVNKWTKDIDTKYEITNDITDKKLWVFKVYWADMVKQKKVFRQYPNFISSTFKTRLGCVKAVELHKYSVNTDYYSVEYGRAYAVEYGRAYASLKRNKVEKND